MPDFDPTKTPGSFGAPPAGAPHETTMPLSTETLAAQAAVAAQNERPLAPFDPPRMGTPPPTTLAHQAAVAAQNERPLAPFDPPRMGTPPPTTLHAAPRAQPPSHQPAASNSDSPSRGIPRPILDPGKQITGGFGHAGEAQYFPLDGSELRELVRGLFDQLNARIENDLRFHLAVTYPRVRARVVIEVEAYAQEQGFEIEKIAVHDKTPLEIARLYGDKIVFAIVEQRQEFTADGEVENPPDRLRDELGLEKPRKQQVLLPGNQRMFVDRPNEKMDGLF